MANRSTEFSTRDRGDAAVIEAFKVFVELLKLPKPQVRLNITPCLGPSFECNPWQAGAPGNDRLDSLIAANGGVISSCILRYGADSGRPMSVGYHAQNFPAIPKVSIDFHETFSAIDPWSVLVASKDAFGVLHGRTPAQLFDADSALAIRHWDDAAARLESTVLVATRDLVNRWDENERLFKQQRSKLEAEFEERRSGLEAAYRSRAQELEARASELESRAQELDDREAKHARRELHKDLKSSIVQLENGFALSRQTELKRRPIHVISVLGLLSALAISLFPMPWLASGEIGQYMDLVRRAAASVGFGAVLWFYIRWNNEWARQHADAEFRMRRMAIDIDRASWLVEATHEWSDTGTTPSPELMGVLSRGLFVEPQMRRGQGPAHELAEYLLRAEAVRMKLGENEVELTGKGLRRASKGDE